MALCPECETDINIGFAGPEGLVQHQGKSKCKENIDKKKKTNKKTKVWTLFAVGMKKLAKLVGSDAEVESCLRKASSCCGSKSLIVVGPNVEGKQHQSTTKSSGEELRGH